MPNPYITTSVPLLAAIAKHYWIVLSVKIIICQHIINAIIPLIDGASPALIIKSRPKI